ncbi:MAG: wax ester/triacylglycerol synthase family O-acyltransferase [Jatrophihabitans sp.]
MAEQNSATRRPMEPFDALMYRSESDPRARSDMLAVFTLDKAPTWDRFVDTFDRVSREIPALRQRVVESPVPWVLPQWVIDPDFDLRYHLRRIRLPEPGTWRQLLDALEPLTMSPLDHARPLWEFSLAEGLEGGRAAFVTKLNHAVTDGMGGLEYMQAIFDADRDAKPRPMPPKPAPLDITPRDLLRQAVRGAPRSAVGTTVRSVRRQTRRGAALVTGPRKALSEANSYVHSFRRVLTPPPVEPSPLLRRRSLQRRLITLELELPELKRAAKSVGGSVNDGLLAGVCGGLRIYHEKLGVPVESMSVAIPINLRTSDDPAGGNRWAGAQLALPVGQTDPTSRIQLIREMVLEARAEPAANALGLVAPIVSRIPPTLLSLAIGEAMQTHDVQVSNVPGSPFPLFLGGAEVQGMVAFGPLPGPAAMIVMNTYLQTGYIGVNLDPAAITEPELFEECLQQGIQEVLGIGVAPKPASNSRRKPSSVVESTR